MVSEKNWWWKSTTEGKLYCYKYKKRNKKTVIRKDENENWKI